MSGAIKRRSRKDNKNKTKSPDPASPQSPRPKTEPECCSQINCGQLSTVRDERNNFKEGMAKEDTCRGKQTFFDYDYPTEIVQKRRTYVGIKKVLKEQRTE